MCWSLPPTVATFRLSFEDMDAPPRWLQQLAVEQGLTHKVRMLVEGVPQVF